MALHRQDKSSCYRQLFTVENVIKSTTVYVRKCEKNRYVLREPGKIATRKEKPLTLKIVCVVAKYTFVIDNLFTDGRKEVVENKTAAFGIDH